MKIYAICVGKNESDIIAYSLTSAAKWADKVIFFDTGSTDGTWELVVELAQNHPNIVPFYRHCVPYSDGLRARIFNFFKKEMVDGDWWVIQDADEFYVENPREFISRQRGLFHHINGKKIDFCFDLSNIDNLQFKNDFKQDLKLFNYITPEAWSEPRAIMHRTRLTWHEKKIWPAHMGLVCPEAIHIQHYPLRSIDQIKKRWNTRKEAMDKGGQVFAHWQKDDWREYYTRKATNLQEISNAKNVFADVPFANEYRQSRFKRIIKRILHGLRILPIFVLFATCVS